MTIRSATEHDLPAILDIYNEAVRTTTATFDYEENTLEQRTRWYEAHVRDNYSILVSEDEAGLIAGWGSLSAFHPRPGYRFTAEDSLYIASKRRGQGIGRLLLTRLLEDARERELHSVIALITGGNEISVRLHESFGFQQVGFLSDVGYKFDAWLDVIYMQLTLTPR